MSCNDWIFRAGITIGFDREDRLTGVNRSDSNRLYAGCGEYLSEQSGIIQLSA
jgi:hypothetical protein